MIRSNQSRTFTVTISSSNMDDAQAALIDEAVHSVTNVLADIEAKAKDNQIELPIVVNDDKHVSYRDDTGPF
jgi:hypothetical protein